MSDLPITERLRLNAEMMADGWQGPALTELWHSHVVRDAAADAKEAADLITSMLEALEGIALIDANASQYSSDRGMWEEMGRMARKALALAKGETA